MYGVIKKRNSKKLLFGLKQKATIKFKTSSGLQVQLDLGRYPIPVLAAMSSSHVVNSRPRSHVSKPCQQAMLPLTYKHRF
jgi:hypothetical protein